MERMTTIDLIAENPQAHGVYEQFAAAPRTVMAEVRSITMREFYTAKAAGITPEIVFVLADYAEYGGEKLIDYNDQRYRVVRTYVTGQTIEIYAEREEVNGDNAGLETGA